MSEPKWEDVEVGDAIIADRKGDTDLTISGTVGQIRGTYEWISFLGGEAGETYSCLPAAWTLVDIIKPERPSLTEVFNRTLTFAQAQDVLDHNESVSFVNCLIR